VVKALAEREIRPYKGLKPIQNLFNTVVLQWGDSEAHSGRSISISEKSYLGDPVVLRLAQARDDQEELLDFGERFEKILAATGLSNSEVEFLVTASTHYLKLTEILWRGGLSEILELTEPINLTRDQRPGALQTWSHGCEITFTAVLTHNRPRLPLEPSRKGTWLGRSRFRVSTDTGESGFLPIPLDAEQRERLGLGPGTLKFVEIEDPFDTDARLSDVKVYVDSELLTLANANPNNPDAHVLQYQIALWTFSAIINSANRQLIINPEVGEEDLEGSPVGRVIRHMSGSSGKVDSQRMNTYLERIRRDPERVISEIEDGFGDLRKTIAKTLNG